jgi:hypothetical protein
MNINDVYTTTAIFPALMVLHGSEGIGKTTTASRSPSAIFGQCENGCPAGVHLSTFGLLDSFDKVLQVITILATEPHNYRTFVLDSLDALEVLVLRAVCAEHDWKTIETPGYGKGFVAADRWWLEFLDGIDFLRRERGMMVVLLAHSTIERIDDPRTASYTSYQLRLHRRARGLIQDRADVIAFMASDLNVQAEDQGFGKKRVRADGGSTRWLHFEGRPSFVAKNRYGLPAKMMVPKDFDFEKTLGAYFPKIKPPAAAGSSAAKPTEKQET